MTDGGRAHRTLRGWTATARRTVTARSPLVGRRAGAMARPRARPPHTAAAATLHLLLSRNESDAAFVGLVGGTCSRKRGPRSATILVAAQLSETFA